MATARRIHRPVSGKSFAHSLKVLLEFTDFLTKLRGALSHRLSSLPMNLRCL